MVTILHEYFGPYHLSRLKAAILVGASCGMEVIGIALKRQSVTYSWGDFPEKQRQVVQIMTIGLEGQRILLAEAAAAWKMYWRSQLQAARGGGHTGL